MEEIVSLNLGDRDRVMQLYTTVTRDLRDKGIFQWDQFYPNRLVVSDSLRDGHTFGIKVHNVVVAATVIDTKQSAKYAGVPWSDSQGRPACIHRLAVHPKFQGKGLAKRMLQFAESYAEQHGFSSIRLDVYSANPGALALYQRTGYSQRGSVHFPLRRHVFYCMEKELH